MSARSERGVVLEGAGGVWRVYLSDGSTHDASIRGRLKQNNAPKLTVGDVVTVERDHPDGAWAIAEIHPRRSSLARRAPGGRVGERVVVANVDRVVVVFAFAKPEPHARMIDRFLVIAEANDVAAVLVMNKRELVDDATAESFVEPFRAAGYVVRHTSVKAAVGLDELRAALAGCVSVFTGPSGVGKSSLLNAMFPGAELRVAEISESVNKGRHTTVGARLLPLPCGGFVADTPGLREVGLWGIDADSVDHCFPEFRPFLGSCKFQDCAHTREPGCAVLEGVRSGAVNAARHASYIKLRAELSEATPAY